MRLYAAWLMEALILTASYQRSTLLILQYSASFSFTRCLRVSNWMISYHGVMEQAVHVHSFLASPSLFHPHPPSPRACPRALNSRHNSLVQDGVHKERICILLTPLRQAREHGICKLLQPYLKKQTNPVPTPPLLRRVLTRTGTRSTSLKALSDSQSGAGFSSSLGIIVPPANKKRHSS